MKLNYGEALKYQREINGYTQNALAKATGLKQQMISWWEAGNGLPNIDFCVQLADFYGISVDELIGHEIRK
jgi:transcriptional regulator with XRE-family HTH domain